jgi:hypothetical protein
MRELSGNESENANENDGYGICIWNRNRKSGPTLKRVGENTITIPFKFRRVYDVMCDFCAPEFRGMMCVVEFKARNMFRLEVTCG